MSGDTSKFSAFVKELRRRKVVRTGVAYAIGAWAVWQVVDVVTPALGWSDRVLTLVVVGAIALLPVVLALAWVFELRPERDRAERPQRLGLATAVPASLLSVGLAWLLWPSAAEGVGSFQEHDETLISRCENASGDPNLDGVLNTALEAALRQSSYVSIFSRERARTFAQHYLGRTPPIVVDAPLANEIGVRGGLKVVIHCALHRVGDAYQVSATLTDPQGPNDLAVLTEVAEDGDLVGAIDALSARTREALGESLRLVRQSKPLAAVTTSSLEALKSYTAGVEAEAKGDWGLARQLFAAAATRDTLFARAHAAEGSWHYWGGNLPAGEESYRKALRHPDRISERDRLWIEAGWASSRNDRERAVLHYRAYLERWPEDPAAWYNLGTQYFRQGDCDEAGAAFARVLAIDPIHAGSHINLASCLANTDGIDSALVHYDSAFSFQPGWKQTANLNHEYGFVLVRAGRLEDADELFRRQMELDGSSGASGRRSAALLEMYRGHYAAAADLFEEAARQRQALGEDLSEFRDRLYLAGVYDVLGRPSEALRELDRVDRILEGLYATPSWLLHAVRLNLTLGRVGPAQALVERATADTLAVSSAEQAAVLTAQAELAASRGDLTGALEAVRLAVESASNEIPSAVRCKFALKADRVGEARASCGSLIAIDKAGWEIQEPTVLARFWIGRLEEEQNRPALAIQQYRALLERWGEADAGLEFRDIDGSRIDVAAEARTRLTRLTTGN